MTFTVPSGSAFYYLRIAQPDGDAAVTAPVWVDYYEDLGIRSLEENNGQAELTLFNEESADFLLEAVRLIPEAQGLAQQPAEPVVEFPEKVGPGEAISLTIAPVWEYGAVKFTAQVRGTIGGVERSFTKELTMVKKPPAGTIREARYGVIGEVYRVQGYLTTGNSNSYNTFPNTLYLQDDTGGIALVGRVTETLQFGQCLEAIGILQEQRGNRVLKLVEYSTLDKPFMRYEAKVLSNQRAMDYAANGGLLVQVQGQVQSLEKLDKSIYRMTIQDVQGSLATILIESNIRSGVYGTNELASQIRKGRTVQAVGLVHVDEFGETVLRVRNCDEVRYIAPRADTTNPKTGDRFWDWP